MTSMKAMEGSRWPRPRSANARASRPPTPARSAVDHHDYEDHLRSIAPPSVLLLFDDSGDEGVGHDVSTGSLPCRPRRRKAFLLWIGKALGSFSSSAVRLSKSLAKLRICLYLVVPARGRAIFSPSATDAGWRELNRRDRCKRHGRACPATANMAQTVRRSMNEQTHAQTCPTRQVLWVNFLARRWRLRAHSYIRITSSCGDGPWR